MPGEPMLVSLRNGMRLFIFARSPPQSATGPVHWDRLLTIILQTLRQMSRPS
jgi:hypothetical protein